MPRSAEWAHGRSSPFAWRTWPFALGTRAEAEEIAKQVGGYVIEYEDGTCTVSTRRRQTFAAIADPLFREKGVVLIYSRENGPEASEVAQLLSMYVAAGVPADCLRIPERRPVVYLGLCGRSMVIHQRKKVFCEDHRLSLKRQARTEFPFVQSSQPVNLCSDRARAELVQWIERTGLRFEYRGLSRLGVIVVDPLDKALRGNTRVTHQIGADAALALVRDLRARGIRATVVFVVPGDPESGEPVCHPKLRDAATIVLRTSTREGVPPLRIMSGPQLGLSQVQDFNRLFED